MLANGVAILGKQVLRSSLLDLHAGVTHFCEKVQAGMIFAMVYFTVLDHRSNLF